MNWIKKNITFNKFVKITVLSAVVAISFFFIAVYVVETEWAYDIGLVLPFFGYLFLADILFFTFFSGSIVAFILTPVFGIIASVQTHKTGERGGIVALLLTGIFIVYMISQLLIW